MFQFLLFSAILACTQAIVCPPNYCDTVDCPDVSACNGLLTKGFCGCCDICSTVLAEGQFCLSNLFLGVPSTTTCAAGLHCDPVTHTCVRAAKKDLNSCAARLHEIETSQHNGIPLLGVFKPTCTSDGYYAPVQCHGSVCYCVTQTGVKIESYQVAIYMASQMTCQCARDKYEYMQTGLIGKLFYCDAMGNYQNSPDQTPLDSCAARLHEIETSQHNGMPLLGVFKPTCTSNGYYAPVQCEGSVCYCATQTGEKIESYQVAIYMASQMTCQCARDKYEYMQTGLIGKLFYCDAMGNYQNSPNQTASGPCAQKKTEVEARLQQSMQNGMPLLGLEVPICTADGYYAAKQCRGSQCFCVNKNGASIGNYMVNRWEADDMNCQCARDQYEYQQTGLIGKMFSCASNGNYSPFQCTGSVCYCVDLHGNQVGTTTVNIGMVGSLNC